MYEITFINAQNLQLELLGRMQQGRAAERIDHMSKKKTKRPSAASEVKRLKAELAETGALRDRMSRILRKTADALHGGPLKNGAWSWHNLPTLADELVSKKIKIEYACEQAYVALESLMKFIESREGPDENAMRDKAYCEMVRSARKIGLTPLTPEQFAKEDARIFAEWNSRRHKTSSPNYGVFDHPCIVTVPGTLKPVPWWKFWKNR